MARSVNQSPASREDSVFFVPGQLLFLIEHDQPLAPEALVEALQGHPLVREDERLSKARFSAERVLTFAPPVGVVEPKQGQVYRPRLTSLFGRALPRAAARPATDRSLQAYSTVFADLDLADAELIALVEQYDRRLEAGGERGPGGILLRIITPNWLAAGAPYHIGTGGPGAQPVPAKIEPGAWWQSSSADVAGAPFSFTLPPSLAVATGAGVQVAILDTAPTPDELKRAFHRWQAEHPVLRGLLGPTGALPSARLRLTPGDSVLFARLNSEDGGFQLGDHRYRMADHGLFVAGIIHSIASQASLNLVRVLNNFGVGTLETIARGLHGIYTQRDRSHPLIVNLSLTLSLPLRGHRQPGFGPSRLFADAGFIERMGWPLRWTCDLLEDDGVLIVAAAGNDAQPGNRPFARQPAAFDSVIGVGALRADGQPADYSNLADQPSSIGIATFGGDTASSSTADPERGVLGAYIGEFPDGSPNENGWARWAGTSFAAPAITGILARLRSTVYSPQDALRKVYEVQSEITPLPGLEEVLTLRQG